MPCRTLLKQICADVFGHHHRILGRSNLSDGGVWLSARLMNQCFDRNINTNDPHQPGCGRCTAIYTRRSTYLDVTRERERERSSERERACARERDTAGETAEERESAREREGARQTDRETETATDTETERQREAERQRESARERGHGWASHLLRVHSRSWALFLSGSYSDVSVWNCTGGAFQALTQLQERGCPTGTRRWQHSRLAR